MPAECNRDLFGYEVVEGRQVVAAFDGGEVTSDAGALLLGATDRAIGLVTRFAACFADGRAQAQVEPSVAAMVAQRVFGIALGYEDLVDHDQLRHDPVLAALAGKLTARRKHCAPLAGKSTLNRLEHAPSATSRYHKIGHDAAAIEGLFVELFLKAHKTPPQRIVLDLDATDDPLHGHQEGRFFHGYYDCYCYLPLYVFCDRCRFSDGSKIHLARGEWKFGGWLESIRSVFVGAQFSNPTGWRGFYFKDCTIADYHEIAVYGYAEARWRNCAFLHIMDDGYQVRTDFASRVEFGYRYFRGAAVWGPGEGGNEADDPNPGEIFNHHNIVDNRENRVTNWNSQPHPHFVELQHSADHSKPMKDYNNTVIVGPDLEQEQVAHFFSHNHDQNNALTGTSRAQESFNNISVRQDSQRYDPTTGYSDSPANGQSDHMWRYMNCDANLSNEFHDYNLYYKDVPNPVDGWGRDIQLGRKTGAQSFATLGAFKASSLFTTSKAGGSKRAAYSPGFEANSVEAEPPIPSIANFPNDRFDYRPAPTSAITTAATGSLSGADWHSAGSLPSWGASFFPWTDGERTLAPSPWKGALDPNGFTMPVGVQNP